jgi:hypothetical protein
MGFDAHLRPPWLMGETYITRLDMRFDAHGMPTCPVRAMLEYPPSRAFSLALHLSWLLLSVLISGLDRSSTPLARPGPVTSGAPPSGLPYRFRRLSRTKVSVWFVVRAPALTRVFVFMGRAPFERWDF